LGFVGSEVSVRQGLAVFAFHVLAVEQRRFRIPHVLPQQGPALDQLISAEMVAADVQEVEGVEARCSGPRAAQERVEVRQALRSVRHGLPSMTILASGRAITAALMATNRRTNRGRSHLLRRRRMR
jgi:hypothetical protein